MMIVEKVKYLVTLYKPALAKVPHQQNASTMDEYERKFTEMQKYIPFLEAMIERLKKVKDNTRASQLQKMESLHGILLDSKRKLKLETLQRCEEVLQKLHSKVEKGNQVGPKLQNTKNTEDTKPNSSGHLEPKIEFTTDKKSIENIEMKHKVVFVKKMEDEETPASPSPPASPDQMSEPKPIIIPTERSDGFTGTATDDRPASPDACEKTAAFGAKTPIVIPTERENPLRKIDPEPNTQKIPTWTYDGIQRRVPHGKNLWQSDSSSRNTDTRTQTIRHIPTLPIPLKASACVLRKPVLVLDKNSSVSDAESQRTKFDSQCVTEARLLSPDRDSHVPRTIKTSPKSKDLPPVPKLSTSLLVSPPPVLTMPPLTIEDLAELLQDESDKKNDKKSEISNKEDDSTKTTSEGTTHEIKKPDRENDGKVTTGASSIGKKDDKNSKNLASTPMDVDRDTEKRWEEVDKPIVKMQSHHANRRSFTNSSGISVKHADSKGSSGSSSISTERPTDPRNRPPSPAKDRDGVSSEVRFADNYEKHSRQSRDNHKHASQSEINSVGGSFSRNSEADARAQSEERGSALYQRRSYGGNSATYQEIDPRREKNAEFYKNIVQREREREREREQEKQREREREIQREREREIQRERERELQREREIEREMLQGNNRGMMHQSPARGGDSCNQGQWGQNMNYPPGPQGPNIYPQQQRPGGWMQGGPNNLPMEPHMMNDSGPPHMRPPQYQGPPNSCGRPMLSPQDMNMGPCMDRNMGPPCMDMNMGPPCMDMNMGPRMDSGCMDMNMGPRMDPGCMDINMGPGFQSDMPNQNMGPQQQHPNAMPGLMGPNGQGYPMGPQYHQFSQENRQNVQQFDRPQDFQHSRPSWDQSGNRSNDNVQYPRSQGPSGPPQAQWNQSNRGGGGSGVPQPVPPPLMSPPLSQPVPPVQANRNFNDRGRGADTSRNSSYNRDPRDSRGHRDSRSPRDSRDPRVRTDNQQTNSTSSNSPATGPPANQRREHSRFSKEPPPPPSKPREPSTLNDRNQRRRPNDPKDTSKNVPSKEKELEREKARKREDKKKDPKNDKKTEKSSAATKTVNEKLPKDVMQSPLESLYGVIDTTAKTGKGYGIQKFKIPKLRKPPEPLPPPEKGNDDAPEEDWDVPDDNTASSIANERNPEIIEITTRKHTRNETDDKKSEVTSTTCESLDEPQIIGDSDCTVTKEITVQPTESDKITSKLPESEQTVDTSTKNSESIGKDAETPKLTEEVTQELIQALIRKSLESGEVKELFESRVMQKFGEAFQGKRFKKILNILDSDSESGSDKEGPIENKKIGLKKKRRVILSDSSDDECLAERLGKIDPTENDTSQVEEPSSNETNNEKVIGEEKRTKSINDETLEEERTMEKLTESIDGEARDKQDSPDKKGKASKQKKRERRRKPGTSAKEIVVENVQSSETIDKEQGEEKRAASPKNQPVKAKPKRRNSLEMLQEDIREMFISEGVVTATGHRMCRLIKEAQENLTTTVAAKQTKKGSTGSLDRQGARNESDSDDEIQRPQSVNSKGRGGRSKIRTRVRNRTRSRKITKPIASSDSETEDSVRTELSVQNDSSMMEKDADESMKAGSVDNSKSSKDENDGSHFLRRSERVGLRESVRGSKNDKSESNKLESSKTMFDSSSDESFGIDVSELAAAVDISLHPESRGRITSSPVTKESTNAKPTASRRQRSARAKRNSGRPEKTDNAASADEADSLSSDLSRTSSLTRGKKANFVNAKQDTNEELMTDILTGLVNSKLASNNKSIDGDAENENDGVSMPELKNPGRKKKKKKPSWALGIVKKKKKKVNSPIPTPSAEIETSIGNLEPSEPSIDETNEMKKEQSSMSLETKEEILSDSSISKSTGDIADKTPAEQFVVNKTEPSSPSKNSTSAVTSDVNLDEAGKDEKPLDELLMDDKVDDEDDVTTQAEPCIFDLEKLLNYVWVPKQDRFSCLYCPWSGKNIVHHYTLSHGEKEMLISRLPIKESTVAKNEAPTDNDEDRMPKTVSEENRKFQCRFCSFKTVGTAATEAFYEHCTTHTGEYRFRCRGCTYQTVARSSMRSHCSRRRNNPCRISYINTYMAIHGDPVPDDDILYGYMCTKCNFIQLKKANVLKHLQAQHKDLTEADILKINMSAQIIVNDAQIIERAIESTETKAELKEENDSTVEMQADLSETPELVDTSTPMINVTEEIADSIDIVDEALKNENLKTEEDTGDVAKSANERPEAETSSGSQEITAGNLNAFVCPPELENKEDEIQLERQKKMQEIVKNIGLSNNLNEKRDLSIIDKLKDKMTVNLDENREDGEAEDVKTSRENEKDTTDQTASITLPILLPESVTSLAPGNDTSGERQELSDDPIKNEPEDKSSRVPTDEAETDTEDKSEKKIKDPLMNLDEAHKDGSSDDDDSDIETIPEPAPSYDSDTSTEQSESEVTADVNSLLEETLNNNSSANAPMMTTIQRLAAKLQSGIPFAASSGEKSDDIEQGKSPEKIIPKKPNVIPISSIEKFLDRRKAMFQAVAKEVGEIFDVKDPSVVDQLSITPSSEPSLQPKSSLKTRPKSPPPSSPPKKFIRLRRLSGDKLSVPSPVETPAEITPVQISRGSSIDGSTSDANAEILQTDTEEECSFLRIENVMSLAPGADNNPNETMVEDIRKAVASSSMKSPAKISLLKKGSPTILKHSLPGVPVTSIGGSHISIRPVATMPVSNLSIKPVAAMSSTNIPIRPATTPTIGIPIRPASTPVSIRPAPPATNIPPRPATIPALSVPGVSLPPGMKQNFKIVKVVRGVTLLKQKDTTHRVFGSTMKTAETFSAMLEPTKLRQFYKCMSRGCSYTTDCQQSFGLHYRQHKDNVDRSKGVMTTYDFQRCPYCSETLTTWNAMSEHLKDKHIYCQYQCGYCFYRGLAQSYVELHQMSVHQNLPTSVLLGQRESPPIEVIDRREFIMPFVCHHECGKSFYVPAAFLAHLRSKHGNSLSIFKCHLCPAPSFKAEQLIGHYKLHGIYKYQCLYCFFGSEQASDVHAHLSASHYNRPPHVLERTLQPNPVRDKDVIQQLIILNVDENYKCSEITLTSGQDASDIPKNKHWIQVDRNMMNDASSAVGEVTLPIGSIGMSPLFSHDKTDSNETSTPAGNNATPIISKIRKITPKKSSENVLIVADTAKIRKLPKRKDIASETPAKSSSSSSETKLAIPKDSPQPVIIKQVQSSTSNFQCNEEFVNFNILDNPDFLKAVDSINEQKTIAKHIEVNDDDSDIEIIEDIAVTPKKKIIIGKSERTISPTFLQSTFDEKDEDATELLVNVTDLEPLVVCSSNENSLDANVEAQPMSVEAEEPIERPLTLDDIRNTGFMGAQLYKCGYDGCEFGAETPSLLKMHIKECFYASDTKNLNCVHCNKRFVKAGFLVEHFRLHGLKRFGCSLCKDRWPMSYQAMSHMKTKHKHTYTKLIPADPKNPSADGLYVVEPIPTNGTSRSKKRGRVKSSEKEFEKTSDAEKTCFGPADIEALPRQAIYQRDVQCAVCPYTTKVRTNIIRHLQLHAKDETVPESGPVNPVPCLDKKERMFDKMVNLASSSHQNGRMGGKKEAKETTDDNAELLPKFVPEHKRYVCGVTECNYLTCDESMLRYHLKALHVDEAYFRCPHCTAPAPGHEIQNIAIDKMAVHLKMHDSRLYKCSHCNYHHYHRHVVERHLTDKHPEMNPYVKVIREPDNTEAAQQSVAQEEGEEGTADTEGDHWKCNRCEYKCAYKVEMVTHASTNHDEKGQFKCNTCSYKTNNKISFDQHVNAKHPYDLNADHTLVYQKIKGIGSKKTTAVEPAEASGTPEEPFDTTPLWRRDMPRVRHIRGILFEEENPSKPEAKSNKRKSDAEPSAKAAKSKSGKSAASEASSPGKDSDSLWNGTVSSGNSCPDPTSDIAESFREAEAGSSTFTTVDMAKLTRKFGPLGSPIHVFYRCTICQTFKTKYKHDMRDHLYRDLKYWRYRCTLCGHMGVNKTASLKHFERVHEPRRPTETEQTLLPIDHELETWVQALLKSQSNQMRGFATGSDGNALQGVKSRKTNSTNVRRSSAENWPKADANIAQSVLKESSKKAKTVDLARTISDMKRKSLKDEELLETNDILIEDDENDNQDLDALVIDSKEDFDDEEVAEDTTSTNNSEAKVLVKTPFTCKHCNVKIGTARSFKLHVEVRHLKLNAFLCRYCDTSLNTEKHMLRHLQITHSELPATVVRNPNANSQQLTAEFWEKEYKLMSIEKSRKRKRNEDDPTIDPFEKTPGVFHICNKCGFRAINYFGLSVHMRRHATTKDYKCAYCTYAACTKSELWQHSEVNHSNLDWKVGNGDDKLAGKSDTEGTNDLSSSGRVEKNYHDYEEEAATSGASGSLIVPKADMLYSCFYCNSGKTTLEGVEEHWKMVHKNATKMPGDCAAQKTDLPFRYKEIPSNPAKNSLRCGYCPKRGTAAQIRLHSRKKHASKPVKFVEIPSIPQIWVCQWCEEVGEGEGKKKVHHNMFHSHLAPNFKPPGNASGNQAHACPECPFKATSRTTMEKHLEKHVDSVICKRCDKTFRDVSIGILHNTQAHPGEVSKIEGFKTNVERMMARVKWHSDANQDKNAFETVGRSALESNWKNCGVAKKSTTKSIVYPIPTDVKAVARKSTNPLPRYPPGVRFATSEDGDFKQNFKRERSISYYGKPVVPVNLSTIKTYITLSGGRRMKLTCSALAQLIDIEPYISVEDLKHNSKNLTIADNA